MDERVAAYRQGVRERNYHWRKPRHCGYCDTVFVPTRKTSKWCSVRCRVAGWRAVRYVAL